MRDCICQEISRHKLRTSKAPKDFISCYLAQITKVGLKWLQREGGGCLPVMSLVSRPWPQFLISDSVYKLSEPPEAAAVYDFFFLSFPRPGLVSADMGRKPDVRTRTQGQSPPQKVSVVLGLRPSQVF